MSIARNVVIYGRIWRGKPFHKVLSRLVPCGSVRSLQLSGYDNEVTNELNRQSRLHSVDLFSQHLNIKNNQDDADDCLGITCAPSTTLTPMSCTALRISPTSIALSWTPLFVSYTPCTSSSTLAICCPVFSTPNRNQNSGSDQLNGLRTGYDLIADVFYSVIDAL
jgi:hypothetical protein